MAGCDYLVRSLQSLVCADMQAWERIVTVDCGTFGPGKGVNA